MVATPLIVGAAVGLSARDLTFLAGAVIVAGVLGFIAAPCFSRMVRFFPPVGTCTVITLVGVSLMPVGLWLSAGPVPGAEDYGSMQKLGLAGIAFVIVALLRRFGIVFPAPVPFGVPQFAAVGMVSFCVVVVVSMTEATADMLALGEIGGRPADEKTIVVGLCVDTLGSALSLLFGGLMCSAFALTSAWSR